MTSPHTRDDDPVHPNFDGIRFQATTDRKGVVAVPLSAQAAPPISYLPVDTARELASELANLIVNVRRADAHSYAADYFEAVLDDLDAAIRVCVGADLSEATVP